MINPFVGPKPLTNENPIFGRDREIRELLYLLTAERIVLLHSPSGAGKSSLIQARGGLMDKLKEHFTVWPVTRVGTPMTGGSGNRYVSSAISGFGAAVDGPQDSLTAHVTERRHRECIEGCLVLIFD